MAGYQLNYDALNELFDDFKVMDAELKASIKETAKEIGSQLKSNTEAVMPREPKAKHGTHMADDVKMSVSVSDKKATITVKGGKATGSLWWNVDSGHIARDGKTWVAGKRFTDKAYQGVDVAGPVDSLLQKVAKE